MSFGFRHSFLLFCSLIMAIPTMAQLEWQDFNSAEKQMANSEKILLVYIYADWCKVCKSQERSVFSDSSISEFLNREFIPLKLNADSEESIRFLGREYQGASMDDYHELAQYLALQEGQLIFPSLIFINQRQELIYRSKGKMSKTDLLKLKEKHHSP